MLKLSTIIVNQPRAKILEYFPDLTISGQAEFSRVQMPEPQKFTEVWYADLESPIPKFAVEISQKLQCAALGVINWDDDLLRIWAFSSGEFVTAYDSNPSYATCTITPPELEPDTGEKLARLFNVPQKAEAVRKLLTRKKGFGFINETQRLEQLFARLEIP